MRKCILHLCSDCPGKTNLNKFLTEHFINNEFDLAENNFYKYIYFAENYSFVDAVQGFHWENSQATLHPFVAYFRSSSGDLKHTSICVISDCFKHDQITVHCFLTKVITLMKQKVNNIKIIHYYSDGAPSQYKNYNGLVNLCHHRLDHGIDPVWNFFWYQSWKKCM